jgi:hypothetical protein
MVALDYEIVPSMLVSLERNTIKKSLCSEFFSIEKSDVNIVAKKQKYRLSLYADVLCFTIDNIKHDNEIEFLITENKNKLKVMYRNSILNMLI